jgi:hypothetical protein
MLEVSIVIEDSNEVSFSKMDSTCALRHWVVYLCQAGEEEGQVWRGCRISPSQSKDRGPEEGES